MREALNGKRRRMMRGSGGTDACHHLHRDCRSDSRVRPSAAWTRHPRSLVAVWAHADDEAPVGPVLARYAREGVQVHMIIATDGAQGVANTAVPRGPEITKLRVEEARCSAQALGIQARILLGFPDGALGNYNADPTLLFRLTQVSKSNYSGCGRRSRSWKPNTAKSA